MVTVFIPQALRSYSQGKERVDVEGGGSLRQVIDKLDGECPGLKSQLIQDDDVRPGLAIFVNDEIASQGLIQRVPDDGSVLILPAIGGGSLHDSYRAAASRIGGREERVCPLILSLSKDEFRNTRRQISSMTTRVDVRIQQGGA